MNLDASIDDVAHAVGRSLIRWGRINVSQTKEKWGTVRVYCSFGFSQFHSISHPGYAWNQYPQWLWNLDCIYGSKLMWLINWAIVPYHEWLYRRVYKYYIDKYPEYHRAIKEGADYNELLRGL